jgi:ABC-2 type transport system permease protein
MPENVSQADLNAMIASKTAFVEQMGKSFPPSVWATFSLSLKGLEGIGYFILFLAVSIVLFVLLLELGNMVFYKSVLAGQEATGKKKKKTSEERAALYSKGNSVLAALFKKEWKLLFKTPVFLLNGMSGAFAGPILGLMPIIGKKGQTQGTLDVLNNEKYVLPLALGALGLVIFAAGMNLVASTAISREGQTFWISKIIPVPPETQVKAKLLLSLVTSAMVVLLTGVIITIVLRIAFYRAIIIMILGLFGSVPMTIYNMMIDISRPKLGWTNPQEAIKSNLNGILGMVISIIVVIVLAAAVLIMMMVGAPEVLIYVIIAAVITIITIPGYHILLSMARSKYTSIEM